jgi:hypothetical protein
MSQKEKARQRRAKARQLKKVDPRLYERKSGAHKNKRREEDKYRCRTSKSQ